MDKNIVDPQLLNCVVSCPVVSLSAFISAFSQALAGWCSLQPIRSYFPLVSVIFFKAEVNTLKANEGL